MTTIPVLSYDLIQALDKDFPERCPDPALPEREIWMQAGERRLVRMLLARLKQMEEDAFSQE